LQAFCVQHTQPHRQKIAANGGQSSMNVKVRLSVGLAQSIGNTRFSVDLPDDATVDDLLAHLRAAYPATQAQLQTVVPMISGRHAPPTEKLTADREVALLLPVAGG
jgi:molybdopterin converting factor small subunit